MTPHDDVSDLPIDTATQLHRAVFDLSGWLRAARPTGAIGISKLGVLAFLHRGGTATASALAALLRMQPQSMTRLLADLEARGLIVRQSDDEDQRQKRIEITPPGIEMLLEDVHNQRMRLAEAMRMRLTPAEQDMLRLAAELMIEVTQTIDAKSPHPKNPNA